ncbi:unnamed protein product [Sphagnum jensenii]|uniref:Uncharacterized protein n=1 Tax=Sphagnum jensenii TaxID=128206 RepID=A0ABP0WXD7_9BRYO
MIPEAHPARIPLSKKSSGTAFFPGSSLTGSEWPTCRDYPSVQGSFFGRSSLLIGHGGRFQFLTWSATSMFIGVCCG